MPMGSNCEVCYAPPPRYTSGEWAGQTGMHTYCEHCSKDLCADCIKNGRCRESPDAKHKAFDEDGDA